MSSASCFIDCRQYANLLAPDVVVLLAERVWRIAHRNSEICGPTPIRFGTKRINDVLHIEIVFANVDDLALFMLRNDDSGIFVE